MAHILVVDDEKELRDILEDILTGENYKVTKAENGEAALDLLYDNSYDLVLLDVMMPDMDGWSVLREIREMDYVPVIMLTARNLENDEVFGFELGADEYITKPFRKAILLARIKSILKRSGQNEAMEAYEFDGLHVDTRAVKVTIDGAAVNLSSTEYELLLYLIVNKGVALSREQILDKVWGMDYFGGTRTVDTHIKRLRSKIGNHAERISTVRGVGYRFEEALNVN